MKPHPATAKTDKGFPVHRHRLIALPLRAAGTDIQRENSPPRTITLGFLSQVGVAMIACHLTASDRSFPRPNVMPSTKLLTRLAASR